MDQISSIFQITCHFPKVSSHCSGTHMSMYDATPTKNLILKAITRGLNCQAFYHSHSFIIFRYKVRMKKTFKFKRHLFHQHGGHQNKHANYR